MMRKRCPTLDQIFNMKRHIEIPKALGTAASRIA
jgi:hypothetical protein